MANHFTRFRGRNMYAKRGDQPAQSMVPTNTPEPSFFSSPERQSEFVYLGQHRRPAKRRPRHPHQQRKHADYVKLLEKVGGALNKQNVDDIRFYCKEFVENPDMLLRVRKSKEIIDLLEKEHLIAENNLIFLQTLMYYIGRLDVYNYVLGFRQSRQKELADGSCKKDGINLKIFKNFHVKNEATKFNIAKELLVINRQIKKATRFNIVPDEGVEGLKTKVKKLRAKMIKHSSKIPNRSTNAATKMEQPRKNFSKKEVAEKAGKEEERIKAEAVAVATAGRDTATSRSTAMSNRLQEIDERLKDSLRSDLGVHRVHCLKSNFATLPGIIKSDEVAKENRAMLNELTSQRDSPKLKRFEPLPEIGGKQKEVRFQEKEKFSLIKQKKMHLSKLPVNIYVPY